MSKSFFNKPGNKAQVWMETVIYTLIALVMIGTVLAFVKPKIEELQDKAVIEQSIGMLQDIDNIILSIVQGGSGNQRIVDVRIKKGVLLIDGVEDKIVFQLKGKHQYSEPGIVINEGNIQIITTEKGKINNVNLTRDYAGKYDIQWDGEDVFEEITKAPTSYSLEIINRGVDPNIADGKIRINLKLS